MSGRQQLLLANPVRELPRAWTQCCWACLTNCHKKLILWFISSIKWLSDTCISIRENHNPINTFLCSILELLFHIFVLFTIMRAYWLNVVTVEWLFFCNMLSYVLTKFHENLSSSYVENQPNLNVPLIWTPMSSKYWFL